VDLREKKYDIPTCPHKNVHGGVSTNFDPYGTRRKLGLAPITEGNNFIHFCWSCWDSKRLGEVDKEIRRDTDELARQDGTVCGFLEAWIGHCQNPVPCAKHNNQLCWKCGARATRNCAVASSFVCGVPECDEHPHEHT